MPRGAVERTANVLEAQALLDQAQNNLGYTEIRLSDSCPWSLPVACVIVAIKLRFPVFNLIQKFLWP